MNFDYVKCVFFIIIIVNDVLYVLMVIPNNPVYRKIFHAPHSYT